MPAFLEVFYSPGRVFESLKDRRAAWIMPLLLSIALVLLVFVMTIHFIGMETIMRQQLANTRLSPEQMETALQRANNPRQTYISGAAASAIVPFTFLAVSGMLMVFAMMSSRPPRFGTMFSMVALAFLPYYTVVALMTVCVLLISPDPQSLNVSNLLATNLGSFLDPSTTSRWLFSLAGSVDVLSFAEIGMLSYGFAKITRSSFGTGLFAVLCLWALYVFSKTILASLF